MTLACSPNCLDPKLSSDVHHVPMWSSDLGGPPAGLTKGSFHGMKWFCGSSLVLFSRQHSQPQPLALIWEMSLSKSSHRDIQLIPFQLMHHALQLQLLWTPPLVTQPRHCCGKVQAPSITTSTTSLLPSAAVRSCGRSDRGGEPARPRDRS